MKDNVKAWEKLVGLQTWHDKSGQYTLRARYYSEQDGRVTLVTEKGEHKSVELKALGKSENTRVASIIQLRAELEKQAAKVLVKYREDTSKILPMDLSEAAFFTENTAPLPQ